jgi:hypothetical protein
MKRSILLLVALVGCDRWGTCDEHAEWSIDIASATPPGFPTTVAARAPDGSVVLAISDPEHDLRVDGRLLVGPHLVRVGDDGQIRATVPATIALGRALPGEVVTGATRVAVRWYQGADTALAVYDVDFTEIWASDIELDDGLQIGRTKLALGPQDQIVSLRSVRDDAGVPVSVLSYRDANGTELWSAKGERGSFPQPSVAENGDVFVLGAVGEREAATGFGEPHRWRYAAVDGALVEDVILPEPGGLLRSDGSFFASTYVFDDETYKTTSIRRYDASGAKMWSRTTTPVAFSNVRFASSGDLALAYTREELHEYSGRFLILDEATGEPRDDFEVCSAQGVFSIDADRYFAYISEGQFGLEFRGLAAFARD